MEALRLYTVGSSWFSREEGSKGAIVPGQLADLAVLSADYFSIPEEQIKSLEALLTIVGGKPVYGAGPFAPLSPPPPPALPALAPVATYGGYHRTASRAESPGSLGAHAAVHRTALSREGSWLRVPRGLPGWSDRGCDCFVF